MHQKHCNSVCYSNILIWKYAVNIVLRTMGRKKFRFVVRKNEERKKYTAATSLAISIPKTKLPAQSLSSLECQLCTLKVLPSSWTLTTSTDEGGMKKVVLCSLETARDPPIVRYSVTIREDFTWVFSAYGYHVLSQFCRMFSNFPVLLQSVDEVVQVVSVTDVCKVCEGNADAIFLEVAKRRDGVFKDHSGKTIASVSDQCSKGTSLPTVQGCPVIWTFVQGSRDLVHLSRYSCHGHKLRVTTDIILTASL
ncbi:hypothetical protein SPONN_1546 [uncultured Candidatus Thioglobus sp.]|nr:hypothetical protein SPONN_1546 [uncultured Candidatus Thioglobus sp.]